MVPAPAAACPVCFGAGDGPMAAATNVGIMVLFVITAAVLGGFATFFVTLRRRAQAAATTAGGRLDGAASGARDARHPQASVFAGGAQVAHVDGAPRC